MTNPLGMDTPFDLSMNEPLSLSISTSWGGKRAGSGRKPSETKRRRTTSTNRGGSRVGAGRKPQTADRSNGRTFQQSIDRASEMRDGFRRPTIISNTSSNDSDDDDWTTDNEDEFYTYNSLDEFLPHSSETESESDSEQDIEDIEVETQRWYKVDCPVNRKLWEYKAQLDNNNSEVRRLMQAGHFRFTPRNAAFALRKEIISTPNLNINADVFYEKEVSYANLDLRI